jgi:hypothetical protein
MVGTKNSKYNFALWKEDLALWKADYELYGDTLFSIRPIGITDRTRHVVEWQSKMLQINSGNRETRKGKQAQKYLDVLNTLPGWKWKNALFKEQLENFIAHRDEEGRKGVIARCWFEKMTRPGKIQKKIKKDALHALPGFTTRYTYRMANLWSSKEPLEHYLISWHSNIVRNKERLSEECIELLDAIPNWTWIPPTEEWTSKFEKDRMQWEKIALALDRAPSKNSNDMAEKESALWARKIKQKFDQNLSNKRKLLTRVKIEALNHTPHWEWNHKRTAPKLPFQVLREKLREKSEQWSLDKSSKESRTWKKSVNVAKAYGWLSQDEIDMVGSLSGWTWDEDIVEWGINECLRFYTTALHDPFSDKAFRKLERWQKSMRDLVDNGQLHESVIDKLITLHALEPLQRT